MGLKRRHNKTTNAAQPNKNPVLESPSLLGSPTSPTGATQPASLSSTAQVVIRVAWVWWHLANETSDRVPTSEGNNKFWTYQAARGSPSCCRALAWTEAGGLSLEAMQTLSVWQNTPAAITRPPNNQSRRWVHFPPQGVPPRADRGRATGCAVVFFWVQCTGVRILCCTSDTT